MNQPFVGRQLASALTELDMVDAVVATNYQFADE